MPFPAGNALSIHGRLAMLFRGLMQSGDSFLSGNLFQGILRHTAAGLVATGSNQATALPLTAAINQLGTVAASTGVKLPPAVIGMEVVIAHDGVSNVTVYGSDATSDTIDGVATATGVTLTAGRRAVFLATNTASVAEGTQAAVPGTWVSFYGLKSA